MLCAFVIIREAWSQPVLIYSGLGANKWNPSGQRSPKETLNPSSSVETALAVHACYAPLNVHSAKVPECVMAGNCCQFSYKVSNAHQVDERLKVKERMSWAAVPTNVHCCSTLALL